MTPPAAVAEGVAGTIAAASLSTHLSSQAPSRKVLGAEYLKALDALSTEMETAMGAISSNKLSDLEESVGKQELLCARLMEMARELHPEVDNQFPVSPIPNPALTRSALAHGNALSQKGSRELDKSRGARPLPAIPSENSSGARNWSERVGVAGQTLHKWNGRYAALVKHSSRSIELLSTLCESYTGFNKKAHGSGSKHQTWYCEM